MLCEWEPAQRVMQASQSWHTEILRFAQDDSLSGLTDIIFVTLNK